MRCLRLPRLVEDLLRYSVMHKGSAFYRQLAKAELIVIDDFGIAPLTDETVRDLLKFLDDRYGLRSTLITSQLPVDQWHAYLGDRTVADAILDRLVHQQLPLGTQRRLNAQTARRRPQERLTVTLQRPLTNTLLPA